MSHKDNNQKSSKTAMLAAFHRALANHEFNNNEIHGPDHLSRFFLPSFKRFILNFTFIRSLVKAKLKKIIPGMDELMIARTAFYDGLFKDALNNNFPQIVLLGAGYDTRILRFADLNNATRIIELDVLSTQNNKKKCLEKANIRIPEHVTLTSVDFNKESIPDVLEKAGYDRHLKTLFIWEGVTMYLEPASVDRTLEVVTRFSNSDSIIAFDYLVTIPSGEINNWYGVKEILQIMKKQYGDEKFIFSIDEGKIGIFLDERGLKMTEHFDSRTLEKKFLTRKDGSLIGNMMAAYGIVTAMMK
ncbi:MAG: SAM-dependent methyltransferase [Deltaproteobacteria bacterium]|uniref:class I SAM-dependent methyltransferase n=1 Tax=Desulfobacula sp. TaxID=2593537 RepID=UPI0019A7A70D|nr:SAM-dependent methyltransferase [Candidatus Desulfobacula maris]MBL6992643.1 SAM-dependent methyltransferase [Desulfobacula sp.]